MAIAVVGTPYKAQNASADPQVFSGIPATTAGNALVAAFSMRIGASGSVASVTDSAGNTWVHQTAGFVSGSNNRAEIWTCANAASITSLTADLTGAYAVSLILYEISGADPAALVDTKTTTGATSSDAVSDTAWGIGTLTPTAGGNYVLIHVVSTSNTLSVTAW